MLRGLLSFSSMTMISRVLGLARDIAISHVFGAGVATDLVCDDVTARAVVERMGG